MPSGTNDVSDCSWCASGAGGQLKGLSVWCVDRCGSPSAGPKLGQPQNPPENGRSEARSWAILRLSGPGFRRQAGLKTAPYLRDRLGTSKLAWSPKPEPERRKAGPKSAH